MAIGKDDFTNKVKTGMAFHFKVANDWVSIEPEVLSYLKKMGREWFIESNYNDQKFRDDLHSIVVGLENDPTLMDLVKTTVGV